MIRPDPAWHAPATAHVTARVPVMPPMPVGAVEQALAAQLRAHADTVELLALMQRLDP